MTTTDFFTASGTDGRITSQSTGTYAAARDGTATLDISQAAGNSTVGQYGEATPLYACYQSFLSFDTSAIGAGNVINSAVLSVGFDNDVSDTEFDLEAYNQAWMPTLTGADFMTAAELSAGTRVALLASTSITFGGYVAFSDTGSGLASAVNTTGNTELVVASSRHRAGTQPSGNEYATYQLFSSADLIPKLTVDYTPPPPDPNVLRTVSGRRW